ncbi:MAG: hypothetical protein K0S44_2104 [Bacteroidetes bacterium]|jgi:hypothetical protein|nr:hypothetical protein [Bacteroidota bacterium]
MKKIYSVVALAMASLGVFAQATPNAGFETWTHNSFPSYDTPNSWDNLNPSTGSLGVYTCLKATAGADVHSGSAALKLITKSVFGQIANGIVTTGTINTTTQTIGGGISYSGRPDSITGFYKYTSVSGDNGFVELQLLGAGGDTDTVGYARFVTPSSSVGSYARFAKQVVYRNSNPVVKSIWILSSSKDAVTHFVGSSLWADDISMVFNSSTGIKEVPKAQLTVGPNPANNYVVIQNPDAKRIELRMFDVTGRQVTSIQTENATGTLDVSSFPQGLYMYSITDESKKVIKTGKIIVQK